MIDGFKREERYFVFKKSHLTDRQISLLEDLMTPPMIFPASSHDDLTLPTIECVVIESDWPEYEPVWAMLQRRCEGETNAEVS